MDNMKKNEFIPDYASPPGATLIDILELQGMSQVELEKRLGMNKKTINQIIKGKAPITQNTAMRLEQVLNVPASFWITREQQYRETLARIGAMEAFKAQVAWLNDIPTKELIKRNVLPATKDKPTLVQHTLKFFGVASSREWKSVWEIVPVAYRRSPKYETSLGSLAAWLRIGEIKAQKIECKPYDAKKFRDNLQKIRDLTKESPKVFEPEIIQLCAESGVAVVFVSQLQKTHVSGATRWLNPFKAIIQLSLRYKSDDQFWFTFFHEASHVLYHSSKEMFLEGIGYDDEKEQDADTIAANSLIPPGEYLSFKKNKLFSKIAIRDFARSIGVSPAIVVGRLQYDDEIPKSHCNDLKRWFELVER